VDDVTGKMPPVAQEIQFRADRGDAGRRLDQVLRRRVVEISRMSRSMAQQWIEAGAVKVDGRVVRRPATRVREAAVVDVTPPAGVTRKAVPQAETGELRILYEDTAFIAIDKPAGIVVHPSYRQLSGTLLNTVLWHVRDRADTRPGILTRLDKGTSGIVIVASGAEVHRTMQQDAAAGTIRKEYLAIVNGHPRPPAGRIDGPLARDPLDRRRVVVMRGGAASETRYETLASHGPLSLVRCELVTGRTHQIRVHLASCGWPIAGDTVYGVASPLIERQALHAWRMTLLHPVTREPMTIVAPVPDDIRAAAAAAALRLPEPPP
jgi:23S rRNA pseudouridine1911/1915/1917 synthase